MKEIELTQRRVVLVDDSDYDRVSQYKWFAHSRPLKDRWYAVRSTFIDGQRGTVYLHRFLCNLDARDKREVDHRDGDGLNNQRANLRVCTRRQNTKNLKTRCGRRYKGVNREPMYVHPWRVRISINKVQTTIGRFDSEIDAAFAYDLAALKHFGEFAQTNFKDSEYLSDALSA